VAGWLVGYAPDGTPAAAAGEWDEERFGDDEPQDDGAA
jgi:hypothetical protein